MDPYHTIVPAKYVTMKRGNVSALLSNRSSDSAHRNPVYKPVSDAPGPGHPVPFPSHFPLLLFWGTEDTTCAQFLIKKAYEHIPQMQDRPCEGKGHWLMIESRDEVTQKVLEWLSNNSNKSMKQKL